MKRHAIEKIYEKWRGRVSHLPPCEIKVAGKTVHLRCQSELLKQTLLRPFAHLLQPHLSGSAQLEIEIYELPTREPWDEVSFHFSADKKLAHQVLPRSFSLFDREQCRIIAAYQEIASLSLYELGRPLHCMLSLWLNHEGCPLIHAGAVIQQGRGILVGGDSGSGKTTTCLEALANGHGYLGDDMVALDPQLGAHSLYATTFLEQARRRCMAWLGEEFHPPRYPWEDKCLTYLDKPFLEQLQAQSPISEVWLPGPDVPKGRLKPIQALRRLAPSSLLVGPLSAGQVGLDLLERLVRQLPCVGKPWTMP